MGFDSGTQTVSISGTPNVAVTNNPILFRDTIITQQASGSATAPLANTVIATLTPGAGRWEFDLYVSYGAVGDIADNMRPVINGVNGPVLPCVGAANSVVSKTTIVATLAAAQVISINNVAAGGAGAVYEATIVARQVG